MIGFVPIATHDMLAKFCGRWMLQNAARFFNQMVGSFAATEKKYGESHN